jgi:hypothetical protein
MQHIERRKHAGHGRIPNAPHGDWQSDLKIPDYITRLLPVGHLGADSPEVPINSAEPASLYEYAFNRLNYKYWFSFSKTIHGNE